MLSYLQGYKNSKTSPGALCEWEAWEVILCAKLGIISETSKLLGRENVHCPHFLLVIQRKVLPLHPIMQAPTGYIEDEVYGQRLLISVNADPRELQSNIRAAHAILHSFPDVCIIINAHTMSFGHKNPEYTIDGQLGDRKGIMGEKGVTAGFKAAKKQGCKIVVIDLDEHILQVRSFELSKYISRRKADFVSGMIAACYVVFDGEAVVVNASVQTRQEIMSVIEMLNPGTSSY